MQFQSENVPQGTSIFTEGNQWSPQFHPFEINIEALVP